MTKGKFAKNVGSKKDNTKGNVQSTCQILKPTCAAIGTVIAALIACLGVVIAAYINYLGIIKGPKIPIQATQTAEAKLTISPMFTSTATSLPVAFTVNPKNTPTPMPILTFGVDWQGEYYDNEDLSGSPKITRKDRLLHFIWDGNSPDAGLSFQHWSARWRTTYCYKTGPVSFYLRYDDAIRLYIDDRVIWNAWDGPASETWVNYDAGGCVSITVEYRQFTGGSSITVGWFQP